MISLDKYCEHNNTQRIYYIGSQGKGSYLICVDCEKQL
jgi:hypothetical protein